MGVNTILKFTQLPVVKLISIPMNNVTKVPRVLKYRYDTEYQLSISGVLRKKKSLAVNFHVMLLATKSSLNNLHTWQSQIFNNVFNVRICRSNFILLDQ